MDSQQWVARCSARLHEQWPRVPLEQLEELAEELRRNVERQASEPEHAAVEWLRHAIADAR